MPRIFDEHNNEITPPPVAPLVPTGQPLAGVVQEYRAVQGTRIESFQDMVNELASDGWMVHSMHLATYMQPNGHSVIQAIASDESHVSNPDTVVLYVALLWRTIRQPATQP